jgi:hypothetical protein
MAKERVQVQGLGDAVPGIQPTIQRGGQYAVQVQRAGRNKLMDLADALGQVNPLLQQYGALQKQQEQIGIEQAQLVEEQNVIAELKKQKDVDGFSILATTNRDRAYRDALLKRHINNTMLPSLKAQAADLINAETYRTQADHSKAVDDMLSTEWDNLVGQVGEGVANSTAGKALWNLVSTPYKNELALKYEEARDKFIVGQTMNEGQQLLDSLYSTGEVVSSSQIENVVLNIEDQLKEDNPALNNQERNKLLVDMIKTRAKTLQADRRFNDASSLLRSVELIKINGNRIFNSDKALDELNPVRKEINNKIASLKTESKTELDKEWTGLWGGALKRLPSSMTYERFVNNPLSVQTVKDALLFMNPTLQDGEEEGQLDYIIKNEIFNKEVAPALALNDTLLKQAYSDPDRALPLYRRTLKSVGTFIAETTGSLEREVNLYSPTVRAELEKEFLEDWELKSAGGEYDFEQFLSEKQINAAPWSSARRISKEANAGLFVKELTEFKNIRSALKAEITGAAQAIVGVDKQIDDVLPPKFDETHAITSGPVIERKILEYAKAIELDESIPAPEKTSMVLKELRRLQDEDKAIFKAVATIAKERVREFERPEEVELEAARREVEVEKARPTVGAGFPLAPFRAEPTKYKSLIEKNPTFDLINKDRQAIMDTMVATDVTEAEKIRSRRLLEASVYDYGFSSYSPKSAEILKEVGFDYGDVILMANLEELNSVTFDKWLPVIDKIENREQLTKEDALILKEFGAFRVYDNESFENFRRAQRTLIRDRDSR